MEPTGGLEGVGNVDIHGIQSREVQVELLDDRLRSHRVDVTAMLGNLRNQNFAISGGYVFDGGRKIYVRSLGKFNTLEEIGQLIVDPQPAWVQCGAVVVLAVVLLTVAIVILERRQFPPSEEG